MALRCLNFGNLSPPTVHCNDDEEEEYFPTAPLNDLIWSEEPKQERDLCIYMAPRRPEASYPSQIPTKPQESAYKSPTLEELMDSMFSDMPDIIYIPEEVLFQNYLYAPWIKLCQTPVTAM